MKVTFYGVRGSVPTPGPDTSRYGGNTPCTVLESEQGQKLILDAGTGIRLASGEFEHYPDDIHILISHHHWDHIQGFPFFNPIYDKSKTITIFPGDTTPAHDTAILDQFSKSYFPVKTHQLQANITIKKTNFAVDDGVELGDFRVQSMKMNHPDGGSAFRILCNDKIIVYATDNELQAPDSHFHCDRETWAHFCHDADILIHDAQYLDSEMNAKLGWGHSSITDTLKLAEMAKVKLLCMFSHDPVRTDDKLDDLTASILADRPPFGFFFAKENRSIQL